MAAATPQVRRTRRLAWGVQTLGRRNRRNPLKYARLTRPQREVMQDPSRTKQLRGPNQIGKTELGVHELLHRMRGTHPYLSTHPPPIECFVVASSWKQSLVIQRKIWALIPKDELHHTTKFSQKRGFTGGVIVLKNGSLCTIVTAQQNVVDVASATLHFVWCDEPPPESAWSELKARVSHHRGTILLTYTPINAPVEWLKKLVQEGAISDHHVRLTLEACTPEGGRPFKSQQQLDEFRAECLPQERPQRCDGEWEGVHGERVLEAWDPEKHISAAPPWKWNTEVKIGVGIDHGAKAGRQRACLVAMAMVGGQPRAWIMDEVACSGRTTSHADAASILHMLARNRVELHEVDVWRGDRAHGGDKLGNQKSNDQLVQAIAQFYRCAIHDLPEPLQMLTTPTKYASSHWFGFRLMNKMLALGALRAHPRATAFADGAAYWDGDKDSPKKDALDAARYPLEAMVDVERIFGPDSPWVQEQAARRAA